MTPPQRIQGLCGLSSGVERVAVSRTQGRSNTPCWRNRGQSRGDWLNGTVLAFWRDVDCVLSGVEFAPVCRNSETPNIRRHRVREGHAEGQAGLVTPIHTACASASCTAFTTFCTMRQCTFGVGTHPPLWWCTPTQCEHNYSLPIYFAFGMHDTYFWCAVTLVCVCLDALGVNWG